MEFVISALLVVTIITNLVLVNTVKKSHSSGFEILPVLESKECDCKTAFIEEVKTILLPLVEDKAPKPIPKPDESHFAWRNQKEEPKQAPPSPHGPPPTPGPLQRPYGFSR